MRAPIVTFKRAKRLRRDMSLPEVVLWQYLRGKHLAHLRFRRQHPIGPYILDFYCAAEQFCIEVDGATHDSPERAAHDERRTAWLAEQDIRVVRIPASEILNDSLEAILRYIAFVAAPSTAQGAVPLPRLRQGRIGEIVPQRDPPPFTGEGDHPEDGGGGTPLAPDQ